VGEALGLAVCEGAEGLRRVPRLDLAGVGEHEFVDRRALPRAHSIFGVKVSRQSCASWLLHVTRRGFRALLGTHLSTFIFGSLSYERKESNSDLCAWSARRSTPRASRPCAP
jgi:hypothetical protein